MNITMRRKCAFDAIKAANLRKLKTLVLNEADANWMLPKRPWSLLDEAVNSEQHSIAEWLLASGANPNTLHSDPDEDTALGMLLYQLIPIDLYFSPLATAISREDARMIRIFLDAGADLSLPTKKFQGQVDTCEDLIKEIPLLAQEVEALAISAASAGQAGGRSPITSGFRRSL